MALEKGGFLTQRYIMQLILQGRTHFPVRLAVCKHTSFALQGLPQPQRDYFLGLPSWRWLTSTDRQREDKGFIFSITSLWEHSGWDILTLELSIGSAEVVTGACTIVGPLSKSSPTSPCPKSVLMPRVLINKYLVPQPFIRYCFPVNPACSSRKITSDNPA